MNRSRPRLVFSLCVLAASVLGGATAYAQESSIAGLRASAQSRSAPAQLALGRALRRAGHFDEAVTVLRQAAREATRLEALNEIARVRFDQVDFRGSQTACNALPAGRGNRDVAGLARHVCLARSHLIVGRAALADREIAAARQADPNNGELLLVVADAYRIRGDIQNADQAYLTAMRALPGRIDPMLSYGTFLETAQRVDDAEKQYQAAVQADPNDPMAQWLLGRFLVRRRNNPSGALPYLQKAVAERPKWSDATVGLGDVLLALGRAADALPLFEEVAKTDATLPGAQSGLGRARLAVGKFAEAEAPLRLAIQQVPNDLDAHMALADVLAKTQRGQEALEVWNEAVNLQPNESAPRIRAARLAHELGQNTVARAYLDRVIGDHPDDAVALELRADIAMEERDRMSARALYDRALHGQGTVDRVRIQARIAEIDAPPGATRRR